LIIQAAAASICTWTSNRSTRPRWPEKLMFQVTGAFAEFERSMILQRVHACLSPKLAQMRTARMSAFAPLLG
jgi:DNA invertase Pin-like site-specific DNA recombinase